MSKKRCLILSNRLNSYASLFQDALVKDFEEVVYATFDDVVFVLETGLCEVTVLGYKLDEFDYIYFRTVPKQYGEIAVLISEYCVQKNLVIIDSVFSKRSLWIDSKSFQYFRLSSTNIPIIQSYYLSQKNIQLIEEKFTYPLIVKRTQLDRGEGVFLCEKRSDVEKIFSTYAEHLLVQKFIPNDGDIRMFIINGEVIASMKRQAQEGEFRNNACLGATVSQYECSADHIKLTQDVTKIMEYDIAGVDLIFDAQEDKWKVLEVNIAPQFEQIMTVTGVNIPEKITRFIFDKAGKYDEQ